MYLAKSIQRTTTPFIRHFHSSTISSSTNTNTVDGNGKLGTIVKAYNPIDHESKVQERWKKRTKSLALGKGAELGNQDTFRMILPPPNVTGKLHLGHALTVAIQDTICRIKLMKGSNVEWIPGFDHAGIATHSVVSKKLERISKAKSNLNHKNPEFLQELKSYAETNRKNIRNQLDTLGAQLDWDKEYYTLDDNHSIAVEEAFIVLHEAGLIHRGNGIVNWSCLLQSSVADIEVDDVAFEGRTTLKVPGLSKPVEFGILYFIEYQVQDTDAKIIVATSRPETMFGDVAVAVHPDDPKYQEFIGKMVVNPINGKLIPVISDERVKKDFGTGAVKITPAHDKLDFQIGTTNNLSPVKIYNPNGTLNSLCGHFEGTHRFKAREEIIHFLKDKNFLTKTAEYGGSIGICSRSCDIIEPLILPHWFLQTKKLTETFVSEIEKGNFIIKPDYMKTVLMNHLANPHDWCLSRQIQWGHKIPTYYHKDYPEVWVCCGTLEGAQSRLTEKLGMEITNTDLILRDSDVLDTWFSSALIPLSISHWPENQKDLKEISLMETGQDILLFWVWRMVMMNLGLTGNFPFRHVLLHGLVTDHYGSKMSKSRGNVVDPLDIIFGKSFDQLKADCKTALDSGELDPNEYQLKINGIKKDYPNGFKSCGADALRFALLAQDISDQNVKLDTQYLENCKHFCNKLWQAMRMYYHYADKSQITLHPDKIEKPDITQLKAFPNIWILSALQMVSKTYEDNIRSCKFHLVTESIRGFFYASYCDVYLELIKDDLQNNKNILEHFQVMRYVMLTALKYAHPFLPHVTEEIWSIMTENSIGLLIDQKTILDEEELLEFTNYPVFNQMEKLLKIAKEIRSLKGKYLNKESKESPESPSPTFYVELLDPDADLLNFDSYLKLITNHNAIQYERYGEPSVTDLVGTCIELDGTRNCRISLKREFVQKNLEDAPAESQLTKLKNRLTELKCKYESPEFQEKASPSTKNKIKRRIDTIEARITKLQLAELGTQQTSSNE